MGRAVVFFLTVAGALPAGAQALDLRREARRPERSAVVELLRQEDERSKDREPPFVLDVPSAERGTSNVGYGPLRLSSQSPFHALRLELPAGAPSSLPAGRWELRENLTWSRMWAQADDYLLSFETLSQTSSVIHGLTDRLQVELGAVATTRFAGDLDGFVNNFHETFDLGLGGRDTVNEGDFEFRIGDVAIEEGSIHETTDRVFGSLHYVITAGSDEVPAISATLTVTTGIGDSIDLDGDSVGFGGAISAAKGFGDIYAYLSLGFAWFGRESFHGLPLRPYGASILAGLEWRLLNGVSLVVQHLWSPGALEGFEELSRPSYELGLGLKIEAVAGSVFEIGMTENILVFDSSPDFGLHAGLAVRF